MMYPEKKLLEDLDGDVARLAAEHEAWLEEKNPSRAWLIQWCATLHALHQMHLRNAANSYAAMLQGASDLAELEPSISAMEQQNHKNAAARRKGAHAMHAENYAMKANAFSWLDANFDTCKSMDAAAEAMAGKLIPATFRTVRGWVTEWKKLRSAGTP